MRLDAIAICVHPPDDVNVVIEVPIGGEPIKYEMDKAAGTLVVDRSCTHRCGTQAITVLCLTRCRKMAIQSTFLWPIPDLSSPVLSLMCAPLAC